MGMGQTPKFTIFRGKKRSIHKLYNGLPFGSQNLTHSLSIATRTRRCERPPGHHHINHPQGASNRWHVTIALLT